MLSDLDRWYKWRGTWAHLSWGGTTEKDGWEQLTKQTAVQQRVALVLMTKCPVEAHYFLPIQMYSCQFKDNVSDEH